MMMEAHVELSFTREFADSKRRMTIEMRRWKVGTLEGDAPRRMCLCVHVLRLQIFNYSARLNKSSVENTLYIDDGINVKKEMFAFVKNRLPVNNVMR